MSRVTTFHEQLEEAADRVTVALDALIPRADGPESRVISAMRYAALGGGKRLRPFFALECGRLFDMDERSLLRAAAALECVHTYSLIHDDLPCMDEDDLRRGLRRWLGRCFNLRGGCRGDWLRTLRLLCLRRLV